MQIDSVADWPDNLILSSQGKTSDGQIWKKYYFERTYYASKEGSYLIHVQQQEGLDGQLYLMYAKASDSMLGGQCDEIYRKVYLDYSDGIPVLKCNGGDAVTVAASPGLTVPRITPSQIA